MSDTHLDGPVLMPVCPDCDSPLVWPLGKSTPLCLDPHHKHTWWCPTCEEAVSVGPKPNPKGGVMPELTKKKYIYSDGALFVEVFPNKLEFTRDNETVVVSHAEMREIVLGWQRHELRESE